MQEPFNVYNMGANMTHKSLYVLQVNAICMVYYSKEKIVGMWNEWVNEQACSKWIIMSLFARSKDFCGKSLF